MLILVHWYAIILKMVTSNKQSDKKVVKMAEQNNAVVVPQRTLLGEVNEHITCPLCRGYYIDATTIVECLHSFCRSCIIKHLQVKSYCPVCEMMINSAKPNIKLDKALQDIVYKLVPGLFQKEMERRQQFYASRPGPAASATPEQRGEDTERIIFSPEDVISFSLEYADITDTDSISSKSSDSNEPQPTTTSRRFLQCPAVVNISHLKKFLSMKFDIDSTQFAIDILYKRVPLPDYYTLMDIAYIFNWKRNEPMRFFYQIIDYIAIRNRLFDIKRKVPQFPDRKPSPTCTEETNASSPAPNLNDHGSEMSSGTDSPMLDENSMKKPGEILKKTECLPSNSKDGQGGSGLNNSCISPPKKSDDEVEKSQFLISFELTAKNSSGIKTSPTKSNANENVAVPAENVQRTSSTVGKNDESLKRKLEVGKNLPELKKVKIELEKTNILTHQTVTVGNSGSMTINENVLKPENLDKEKVEKTPKTSLNMQPASVSTSPTTTNDIRINQPSNIKQQLLDNSGQKRNVPVTNNTSSPKRKPIDLQSPAQSTITQKMVSPLKLHLPKTDATISKHVDTPKPVIKKMPDLKPSGTPLTSMSQNKGPPIGKLRMDLLANNCDPTIDRTKILSQVKTSLPVSNNAPSSGDPLKSLFDSCKINIPSSLSITLTDQKIDSRLPTEQANLDPKKNPLNKNLSNTSNVAGHKIPSPPVHNYIEILKLPDTESKKPNKNDGSEKVNVPNKNDSNNLLNKLTKPSESSAKGPVPNLKPIADTKISKQTGNFAAPITFQQTFEQQLQTLQSDKKPKVPKAKTQVPKLVPATPKTFAANKFGNSNNNKLPTGTPVTENKPSTALDLSTPHNIQSQLGPQQTKALETMQSIANLAKKQNISSKCLPQPISNLSNRPLNTSTTPLRVPSTSTAVNQMKTDKMSPVGLQNIAPRQDANIKSNQLKQTSNLSPNIQSPGYQLTSHSSLTTTQPSPRSQTRSPSSSPKLVIAEEKQASNSSTTEQNVNQSNQITSTQISNINTTKADSPKVSPGPSKSLLKPIRPLLTPGKMTSIRQPITPNMNPIPPISTPGDYRSQPPHISHAHHAILRHQMEMQSAWIKVQRQYDLFKNMSNIAHQPQSDFNNKDNKQ